MECSDHSLRYIVYILLYHYQLLLFHKCTALAVYVRSPAAYEALKSFNLLQLPSKATLQAYNGAFLDEPGRCSLQKLYIMVVLSIQECQKCILDAASRYKALREQHEKEGKNVQVLKGMEY